MTSQVNERAIYNFVASMDLDQEMRIHLDNALRDYIMYNWSVSTLFFLQQSIINRQFYFSIATIVRLKLPNIFHCFINCFLSK